MTNSLDTPFHVGDRVVVNQHGQDTYGHDGKFLVGRCGTVSSIPQERWNNNCIVADWDDGTASMFGCWAVDLDLDREALTTQLTKEEESLAVATSSGAAPYELRNYRERIKLLKNSLAA
jgi:hypothetical protein